MHRRRYVRVIYRGEGVKGGDDYVCAKLFT